jgi:hypothetical protein
MWNLKTKLGCYAILKSESLKTPNYMTAPYKAAKHLIFDDYEFYHPAFKEIKLQKIKEEIKV